MPWIPRRGACVCLILFIPFILITAILRNLDAVQSRLRSLPSAEIPHPVAVHVPPLQLDVPPATNINAEMKTTIPGGAHIHGFTVLDKLYLRNGTLYVVNSDFSDFPPINNMIMRPLVLGTKKVNKDTTDEDIQFLHTSRVKEILGDNVLQVPGLSVILHDPAQFMSHFYHWWGEIILGTWRVYSKLSINEDGTTSELPLPARFILPAVEKGEWRDRAGINGPLMRAAFPCAPIEQKDYWQDYVKLGATVVFERVILVNRRAAHFHPYGGRWFKMIAGTMNVTVPPNFWAPIRHSVINNILGYIPTMHYSAVAPSEQHHGKPLVTYISRQRTGRRLADNDHEGLVKALKQLEEENLCEVRVVTLENMSLKEQVEVVAKSTILVGVHGNGLTHQLWMPSSSRSTVIEIVYPESYDFDYEMLARNMEHRHYIVWNDTLVTYPKGKYHEGINVDVKFHSSYIPVHGPAVAQTIRQRLL